MHNSFLLCPPQQQHCAHAAPRAFFTAGGGPLDLPPGAILKPPTCAITKASAAAIVGEHHIEEYQLHAC